MGGHDDGDYDCDSDGIVITVNAIYYYYYYYYVCVVIYYYHFIILLLLLLFIYFWGVRGEEQRQGKGQKPDA